MAIFPAMLRSLAPLAGHSDERRRLIVGRLRRVARLALPLIGVAAVVDRLAVASPSPARLAAFAAQAALCLGVVFAIDRVEWVERRAVAVAVGFVAAIYATLPFVLQVAPSDLDVFAGPLVGAMIAPTLLFPWGAGAQAIVSGLLAAGYCAIVPWGDLEVAGRIHVGLALALGMGLSVAGAFILDRQQRANAALVAGLEGAARVSAALARVGQELISSLQLPVLLERLGRLTTEVLGCDTSYVLLWKREESSFLVAAIQGEAPETLEALRVLRFTPARLGGLVEELSTAGVVHFEVTKVDEPTLASKLGNTVMLYTALKRGTEIIGILMAGYRGRLTRFSPEQERVALGIARIASMALENARLTRELEQANELKSEFVATMSHELRTPLNIIVGYGSLLLEEHFGPLNLEQQDALTRVAKSSALLLELIDSTLDLGRLEAGRLALERKEVALREVLAELADQTQDLASPGVRLVFRLAPDVPTIETDPAKLKAVLKNLISNALKFTAEGSVIVEAQTAGDEQVAISVRDTGVGIAADALPIIFEPFRQAETASTRSYGGVGLGLYIVRRLLDLLHGSISVESEPGKGSAFVVRLPVRQPRPANEVEEQGPLAAAGSPGRASGEQTSPDVASEVGPTLPGRP